MNHSNIELFCKALRTKTKLVYISVFNKTGEYVSYDTFMYNHNIVNPVAEAKFNRTASLSYFNEILEDLKGSNYIIIIEDNIKPKPVQLFADFDKVAGKYNNNGLIPTKTGKITIKDEKNRKPIYVNGATDDIDDFMDLLLKRGFSISH